MCESYRRHDISDSVWKKLEPLLPGGKGKVGRRAIDNRRFINGVIWILRTGAPWRDLPIEYGDWKNTHRRFCRWRDKGMWESLLETIVDEPNLDWIMMDSTYIKVHHHAASAVGGEMSKTKGGSIQRFIWPWMRVVCRSECLLQKVPNLITQRLTNCLKT